MVTTKGGGGDKVTYHPYAESEPALNQVLSNVFTKVVSLSATNDKAELESKQDRVRLRADHHHDIEFLECLDLAAD